MMFLFGNLYYAINDRPYTQLRRTNALYQHSSSIGTVYSRVREIFVDYHNIENLF